MDSFKLEQFGGQLPAWDDKLLPVGQASSSLNGYLYSGALKGWRAPKYLRDLTNPAAKMVYRVPHTVSAVATATLFFSGQPAEGDTVFIGEETYKFTATVTDSYDVLIGADQATSILNLYAAITIDDGAATGAGTKYGVGTIENPFVDQTSPVTKNTTAGDRLTVQSPSFGAAFNATNVAAVGANLQWQYLGSPTTTFKGGLNRTFDSAITGDATWLEFEDQYTDVMRSPVVNDQYDRYYFASPSKQPMYNTHDRITAAQHPWLLGVPAPGCAPIVEVEGGGDDAVEGNPASSSSGTDTINAQTIYLIPIVPQGSEILNDVTAACLTTSDTVHYCAVLYEDLDGFPHTLINVGDTGTGSVNGQNITSSFLNPTGLLVNQRYWIGIAVDETLEFQKANDDTPVAVVTTNTFSNQPPAVIGGGVAASSTLQLWGETTTSSVLEARAYVYTYTTEYDEESPPSPATTVTGWSNGVWTVGLFTPPPDQLGVTRNITTIRLYRTVSATGGQTTFFHVADFPVTTQTYTDTISSDIVVYNYQLSSQLFYPPPENLQGIISMPNGISVGFVGNELWFSEPYLPHAWPPSYVLTTEFPIVGIGVSGNSVVAATSANAYVVNGVSPGTMSPTKIADPDPCTSRGSVIGNSAGVFYTSPNGLILISPAGASSNLTEGWITRERWQALTPQKNLRAVFLVSSYFAFGLTADNGDVSEAQRGYTIELNAVDQQSFTIWPQPGGHRLGYNGLTSPQGYNIDNLLTDPWTGQGVMVQNGGIYFYDFSDQSPTIVPYKWRSKLYQQNAKNNFEAMRVFFTVPPGTPTLNPTRLEADTDDPVWDTLPNDRYGFVRVYADGVLVTTRELRTPNELLRICSGFKAFTWQWEFEGRVDISNVKLGTSVRELARL